VDYTRRDFGKLVLAGVPTVGLLNSDLAATTVFLAKPNSKWAGVQVGMNVPYNFGTGNYTPGDEIIEKCIQLGVSGTELRAQPVELFLGSPAAVAGAAAAAARGRGAGRGAAQDPQAAAGGRAGGAAGQEPPAVGAAGAARGEGGRQGGGRGAGRAELTPEQQAAQRAAAEETRKWRTSVSMDKVKQFRKKFEDAGILIEIVKWDGIFTMSDDEVDYCFQVSKALGARALSTEINLEGAKRLGQFADKHKMQFGCHGHAATTAADFETVFSFAKYNGANLDLGHFIAGQGSPIPFIQKYSDRITHVHVKDRKLNNGPNVPFGQGDTPIKEVLQMMRDKKWKFQATIEFEYPVPAGSDRMAEMAKSLEYCRACLLG
jgi:sugar phosphate isomerase/epimerase